MSFHWLQVLHKLAYYSTRYLSPVHLHGFHITWSSVICRHLLFREYISVTKPLHSTVESNFDIICMQKAFLFVGGYSVNLSRTVRTWVRLSFGIIYRHLLCLHVSYETTQSVCKPLSAPLKGSPVKKANTWLHHRPPVSPYSLYRQSSVEPIDLSN